MVPCKDARMSYSKLHYFSKGLVVYDDPSRVEGLALMIVVMVVGDGGSLS